MIDEAIDELGPVVGTTAACAAVGRPRSTHYRWHRKSPLPPKPERVPVTQPRALSEVERKEVLRVLHEPDHVDEAPATVYAKLLDDGVYLASVPTMYRILRAAGEVRERRRQATHPAHKKPELIATAPNEVWSWDITKLLGPVKWTYCGQSAARRSDRPPTHSPRPAHRPLRSGRADDRQARRPPARRPRCHQVSLEAPREQRQPLLREPVPHSEVPTRFPSTLRQFRGCPRPQRPVLRLV